MRKIATLLLGAAVGCSSASGNESDGAQEDRAETGGGAGSSVTASGGQGGGRDAGKAGSGGSNGTGGASGQGGTTSAGGAAGTGILPGDAGRPAGGGAAGTGIAPSDAGRPAGGGAFDWVGVIGTGQSLSVGCCLGPAISTTQPFGNLKLQDDGPDPKYPIDGSGSPVWSAVPLTEPIRLSVAGTGTGYGDGYYPDNIFSLGTVYGETPHTAMATQLSALYQQRTGGPYVTAHTVVGIGGARLDRINKGTRAYAAGLSEAGVFRKLAQDAGKTYGVAAIVLTHGESDAEIEPINHSYDEGIYQLLHDYDADLKAVSGQTRDVIMLASQQSSSGAGDYDNTAVQLWRASVAHPGWIINTGPKYQYWHYGGLHLLPAGYQRLGEKYAEILDLVVNQGVDWKPVQPRQVSRAGAVITIELDVPSPPLQWDPHMVPPHQSVHTAWARGQGFEVKDGAGSEVAIASTEITGPTTVTVTLSQAPAPGTSLTLAYAITQDASSGTHGGEDDGPHGLLRDSDDLVGIDAETLQVPVATGYAQIYVPQSTGIFSHRTERDVVTGGALPPDTVVKGVYSGESIELSLPWPGPNGTARLTLHHDLRNYCVHFAMPVP